MLRVFFCLEFVKAVKLLSMFQPDPAIQKVLNDKHLPGQIASSLNDKLFPAVVEELNETYKSLNEFYMWPVKVMKLERRRGKVKGIKIKLYKKCLWNPLEKVLAQYLPNIKEMVQENLPLNFEIDDNETKVETSFLDDESYWRITFKARLLVFTSSLEISPKHSKKKSY